MPYLEIAFGLLAIIAPAVLLAFVMVRIERARDVRRMHKLREDNSVEFGAIGGPQFKRCKVCGAVRDA